MIYSAIIGALLSSSFVYITLEDGFAYPHSWGVADGWAISSRNGVSNHSGCDILASVFNSLSGVSTGERNSKYWMVVIRSRNDDTRDIHMGGDWYVIY